MCQSCLYICIRCRFCLNFLLFLIVCVMTIRINGETAIRCLFDTITENGIYLLDEPENSLSAKLQLKLAQFVADSARHFNCKFIIATHSPFFLSLPNAKIYNLDEIPVKTEYWTDLPNMRAYFDLFMKYRFDFQ